MASKYIKFIVGAAAIGGAAFALQIYTNGPNPDRNVRIMAHKNKDNDRVQYFSGTVKSEATQHSH